MFALHLKGNVSFLSDVPYWINLISDPEWKSRWCLPSKQFITNAVKEVSFKMIRHFYLTDVSSDEQKQLFLAPEDPYAGHVLTRDLCVFISQHVLTGFSPFF